MRWISDKAYVDKDIKSAKKGEISMKNKESSRPERLFVAIRLPEELRAALGRHCRILSTELDFSKWVHAEDYHITLQFLGDTPPERIPALIAALRDATAGFTPFELSLQKWGTFGPPASPRVLWGGIDGDLQQLHALQRAVTSATLPLGFAGEDREYRPHITMARKYRGDRPYTAERLQALQKPEGNTKDVIDNVSWIVDYLVVFVTRMHKSPMYETVEKITFS
ncbi:RNA 2',3'-cyclic phosphodiesterase [Paenibacillus sp. BR2-3]|uniref:RNA 2',3'-cyclic phosphodiesterase n=1 Tax=Paenibacillus sp. BR2-3 TaxID=3048494 RepID=UPI003977BB9E